MPAENKPLEPDTCNEVEGKVSIAMYFSLPLFNSDRIIPKYRG